MAGFLVDNSVFKKPSLPSRYQKADSYSRACSDFSNNSEYSSLKVKEKIEILERVFPQNDDIWENLAKNIDHLCFVKVSESILQSSGQRSSLANTNTCPSISSQHRLNYTQSSNNARDHILQENLRVTRSISQSQNVCNNFIPERSEQIDSRNSISGYRYATEHLVVENEKSCEVRNLNSKKSSRPTKDKNNASLRLESSGLNASELSAIITPLSQVSIASRGDNILPTVQECTTNRSKKRPCSENPTNLENRKRAKLNSDTSSILTISEKTLRKNNKISLSKKSHDSSVFNSEDLNESLAAFFRKKRNLNLEKPSTVVDASKGSKTLSSTAPKKNHVRRTSKLQTIRTREENTDADSSHSPQNMVIETKKVRKSSSARKLEKANHPQLKKSLNPTVTTTRTQILREEASDSDEISSQSQNSTVVKTKKTRKTKATRHNKLRNPIRQRVRKTQVSISPEEDSDSDEFTSQSQESQFIEAKNMRKPANTKKSSGRNQDRPRKINNPRVKQTQPEISREEDSDSQQSQVIEANNMRKPANTKKPSGRNPGRPRKINKPRVKQTQPEISREEDSDSDEYSSQLQKNSVLEEENATKLANTKRIARLNNKKLESSVTHTNATKDKKIKSSAAQSKKKNVPLSVEDGSATSPANGLEGTVNSSFFSDISTIIGNQDVSLLRSEKGKKSKSRTPGNTDGSMHFLSPCVAANSRSTSGFSAISTPLSKSIAKNVLGKRIKKPSVAAELKNELKPTRKKRKQIHVAKVIQPESVHEKTANTESECEVSDFSDMD